MYTLTRITSSPKLPSDFDSLNHWTYSQLLSIIEKMACHVDSKIVTAQIQMCVPTRLHTVNTYISNVSIGKQ